MSPTLKSLGKELFVPVCLLVGVAAGAVLLGRATDRSAEQFFTRGLKQVGEVAAARLEDYIRLQERTINYAAEQILPSELELDLEGAPRVNISVGDFQRIGGSIAEWLPGFQAVNWVGLDGVIELVSPNDRNQDALGKNLLEHPDETVRKAFATAVASTDPGTAYVRYTPLIELYQGGPGFAVYRAVFDGQGRIAGVLNASFRAEDLLAFALPGKAPSDQSAVAVFGEHGESLYTSGPDASTPNWKYTSDLEVRVLEQPWTLRVGPTADWLERGLELHGRTISVTGLVLGFLLAGLYFGFARKRAQKEESDLRLELALEGARLGVWDWDVTTGTLHLNDRWLAMLGYRPEDVDFDLAFYRSLVHPEDVPVVAVAMQDHLAGRTEVYRTEHRLRARSGEWIWVLDAGRIVQRDGHGNPLRVAGTQTNFTDIRRAEQELERSVGRYRSIFEHSPVGMLEQDMSPTKELLDRLEANGVTDLAAYFDEHPEGVLEFERLPVALDINPAFLKLFFATTVPEYRENVFKMVDERTRKANVQQLVALHRGDTTCETDFPMKDLNGKDLLYTVRLTVAPGCADDFSSVFVSLVDNTRRLREEEQRRLHEARDRQSQKDESLALLAGGVAHDFNNLLVPIIGNIELAMHGVADDGPAALNLRRAEQAAQRAADLARQMLTYSGRGQIQNEVFDVNTLVGEMSDLLSASLPGKVDLMTDLFEGVLYMEGDPTQLRQLVMNLVINAADAIGGEAGRVVVRTGRITPTAAELEGAYLGEGLAGTACAFIEVRDTGDGVDEETLKRMFEPFFSTKSAGRGLGMSVVLGIVRGHGGALTVSSRLGRGTRIRALMPSSGVPTPAAARAREEGTRAEQSAHASSFEPAGLVLFADDEVQVRRFAQEALGRAGIEAVCAVDGLDALKLWRARPGKFDLVILDATMPRMGGVEAMEEIRAERPRQAIVLSSGYTQQGVASRAAESALCWFLPKPFGVSELNRLVTRVLAEVRGAATADE